MVYDLADTLVNRVIRIKMIHQSCIHPAATLLYVLSIYIPAAAYARNKKLQKMDMTKTRCSNRLIVCN